CRTHLWVVRISFRAGTRLTPSPGRDGLRSPSGAAPPPWRVPASPSGPMFACGPAPALEVALSDGYRFVLKRRGHGIVPAIEETEQRYHPDDFDNLFFRPLFAQLAQPIVGHRVGPRSCREGKIKRCPFRSAIKRVRLILPDRRELFVFDAEVQGAAGGVRHAILASRGAARHVRDDALEAAIDFALRVPH